MALGIYRTGAVLGDPLITPALIYVVDDDPLIGLASAALLRGAGYIVRSFISPGAFLAAFDPEVPGCVVTDLVMPEMSGIQLQSLLAMHEYCPPIIFVSGKGDVKTTAAAMKAGAVDFLCKPVQPDEFLAAVHEAVSKDAELRANLERRRRVRGLVDKLTPQERDVLGLLVQGFPNKVIAARLGRGERTIKHHKKKLMGKMGVRSAAALLQVLVDGA